MRKGRDGGKKKGKKQENKRGRKTDENSGHYVIASSQPPECRPLERRTLAPKLFPIRGYVPKIILMYTLAPLRKDNLGDITSSDNYRAIAGGSLLLKLLDTIILMLEGEKLGCDKLQFGY